MKGMLPRIEALPTWVIISGPTFFLLFVGIVWWVFRKDRKSVYEHIEQLPLKNDEE